MTKKRLTPLIIISLLIIIVAMCLSACGKESDIDYLELLSSPKTSYVLGESLDLTNAQLRVVFDNKSEKVVSVTDSMVSGFQPTVVGEQYLKIYYGTESVTFVVNVVRPKVAGTSLYVPAENLQYIQEQNLSLEGAYITVNYVNGASEQVPLTLAMCEGYDMNTVGSQSITVTYKLDGVTYTLYYVVVVSSKELVSIKVQTQPTQTVYYSGESQLDFTGGVLFMTYSSGYARYVDMDDPSLADMEVTWDNVTVTNNSKVTVSYQGCTASFYVKVAVRDVIQCEFITEVPDQLQYLDLDPTGAQVRITYNNGAIETVTLPSDKVSFVGYDKTKAGTQVVNISFSYNGVQLAYSAGQTRIFTTARTETAIQIIRPEGEILYIDTPINAVGNWQFRRIYNNGDISAPEPVTAGLFVGGASQIINSFSEAGTYTYNFALGNGVALDYEFEVVDLYADDIQFDGIDNLKAYINGEFLGEDIILNITYASGAAIGPVYLSDASVSFTVSDGICTAVYSIPSANEAVITIKCPVSQARAVTAEFTYTDRYETEGYKTNLAVTVVERIENAEILSLPARLTYVIYDEFEPAGLSLKVNLVDITFSTLSSHPDWIFYTDESPEYMYFTTTGAHTVYCYNAGMDEPLEIPVTVTNNLTGIGPLYRETALENPEVYDSFAEVAALPDVVQGNALNLEHYFILLTYEYGFEYLSLSDPAVGCNYNYRNITTGVRNLVFSYNGLNYGDATVRVVEKSVEGIEVYRLPVKTTYIKDSTGTLIWSGMAVRLVYNNNTSQEIDVASEISSGRLKIYPFETNAAGKAEVEVSYTYEDNSYATSFEVDIVDPAFTSIVWKNAASPDVAWQDLENKSVPVSQVYEGSEITVATLSTKSTAEFYSVNFATLWITVSYSDGSSIDILLSSILDELTLTDYDKNTTNTTYPKLVYNGIAFSFVLEVLPKTILSINMSAESPALETVQGAALNLEGVKLVLQFSNGTNSVIPMLPAYINYSAAGNPDGYDSSNVNVGNRAVTVAYVYNGTTYYCQVNVNVRVKTVIAIEISDVPKQYYIEGESYTYFTDDTGTIPGSVSITYDNGLTDILSLEEAVLFLTSSSTISSRFYILANRFNSEEFSGSTKKQTIFIYYVDENNNTHQTSYDVYMNDRKNVAAVFGETTSFTYGEQITRKQSGEDCLNFYEYEDQDGSVTVLDLSLYGYSSYNDPTRSTLFAVSSYNVRFIESSVWLSGNLDAGADYTVFPTAAGVYYVVVTYDGDAIHNAFIDASATITINKRKLYFSFAVQSKVYGGAVPDILFILKATASGSIPADPISLFAPDDRAENFRSANFNPSGNSYSSVCYLAAAEGGKYLIEGVPLALDMFDIVYKNSAGNIIDITESTIVGSYSVNFNSQIVSANYDITYASAAFNVLPRPVKVVPNGVSYEYGDTMPTITYTTSATEDPDSGLIGSDSLSGTLYRENSTNNNVGSYKITAGTLANSNRNYLIVFDNDTDTQYVTILRRTVYLRVDSTVIVYGEPIGTLGVSYFRNAACTDPNAFAFNDTVATVGTLQFNRTLTAGTPVGTYEIIASVVPGTGNSSNYNINFVKALVEIAPRPVTVTAVAASKVFGNADPAFTYIVSAVPGIAASGLVIWDGVQETLAGTLSRENPTVENAGSYTITLGTLQSSNPNYVITFTSAKLTVNPRTITVTLDSSDINIIYNGKNPSINYSLVGIYDGTDVSGAQYAGRAVVLPSLNFSFTGGSRNVGSYPISVASSNVNYSVRLHTAYSFVISRRPVTATYYVTSTADGTTSLFSGQSLVYTGQEFTFAAVIDDSYLQYVYSTSGEIETDENNNYVKDTVTATLSLMSATAANTYSTSITQISSNNYELLANPTVAIVINPQPIVISLMGPSLEGNTIYREYDGKTAYLKIGTDYPLSSSIDYVLGVQGEVADVYYDSNGNLMSYPIVITKQASDSNYTISLAAPYRYVITPKAITVSILANRLYKNYDGKAPLIDSTMYKIAETVTDLQYSDIDFTFARELADGRDNTSVGTYAVSLHCKDPNYEASLFESYVYSIRKANVTFTMKTQGLSRSYNGQDVGFTYSDLEMPTYSGTQPYVHNFAFGSGYSNFVSGLATLTSAYNDIYNAIKAITFEDMGYVKVSCAGIINKISLLIEGEMITYASLLQPANLSAMNSSLAASLNDLSRVAGYIDSGENTLAQNAFVSGFNTFKSAFNLVMLENNYIAFIFGNGSEPNISQVGVYPFTITVVDYNRNFTCTTNSSSLVAVITQKELQILINGGENISQVYGLTYDETIPFVFYDAVTGATFTYEQLNATGTIVRANSSVRDAGVYDIDVTGLALPDNNYTLKKTTSVKYVITKAKLTVRIKDITHVVRSGVPIPLIYGESIYETDISVGGYDYIAPSTPEEYELYGFLRFDDTIDIIKSYDAQYFCYLNGSSGPMVWNVSNAVPVGTYPVTASGFFTLDGNSKSNYDVFILPGTLTVSRAPITVALNASGNLERQYGHSTVSFNYVYSGDLSTTLAYVLVDGVKIPYCYTGAGGQLIQYTLATVDLVRRDGINDGALDTALHVGETTYELYISDYVTDYTYEGITYEGTHKIVFDNYEFSISYDPYNLEIVKAPLVLTVKQNGSSTVETTYGYTTYNGADFVYQFIYEGLAGEAGGYDNIEHEISFLGIGIGGANSPEINFNRNAGTYQIKPNFMNVALADYDVSAVEFTYTVRKLDVKVYLGDSSEANTPVAQRNYAIYAMYDQAITAATGQRVAITPYLAGYNQNTAGGVTYTTSAAIIGGYYSVNDFVFSSSLGVNNAAFVEGSAASVLQLGGINPPAALTAILAARYAGYTTYGVFKADELYLHSVTLTQNQTGYWLNLNNMVGSDGNELKNYNITYEPCKVVIYAPALRMTYEKKDYKFNIDFDYSDYDITVWNDMLESSTVVADDDVFARSNLTVPTSLNKNGGFALSYYKKYTLGQALTDTAYLSFQGGQGVITATDVRDREGNSLIYEDTMRDYELIVPIRFYEGATTSIYNNPEGINYGAANTAGAGETTVDLTSNGGFDMIETAIRLVPSAFSTYKFKLYVYNDGTNYIYIDMSAGTADYVTVYVGDGSTETHFNYRIIGLSMSDGFTHYLRVYLDKELATIQIAVDSVSGAIASLDIFDVETFFQDEETSYISIGAKQVTYYVRRLVAQRAGYQDGAGTFIRNSASGTPVNITTAVPTANATVALSSLFNYKSPAQENYEFRYYIDGVYNSALNVTYGSESGNVNLALGNHTVEMVVFEILSSSSRKIVSKLAVNVVVSVRSTDYYVNTHNITYGGAITGEGYVPLRNNTVDKIRTGENTGVLYHTIAGGVLSDTDFFTANGFAQSRAVELSFTNGISSTANGTYASYINLHTSQVVGTDIAHVTVAQNPNYKGIGLAIIRTVASGVTSYELRLYVSYNSLTDYITLYEGDDALNSGVMRVGLYFDRYTGSNTGAQGFRFSFHWTNGTDTISDSRFIDKNVTFDGGRTFTDDQFQNLGNISPYRYILNNDPLTLFNAAFDGAAVYDYDYLIGNSSYARLDGGNAVDASSVVTLVGRDGNALWSTYDALSYVFKANEETVGSMSFVFGATETSDTTGRGMKLTYDKSVAGNAGTLKFSFYSDTVYFRPQNLMSTMDLLDGETYKLSITFDRFSANRSVKTDKTSPTLQNVLAFDEETWLTETGGSKYIMYGNLTVRVTRLSDGTTATANAYFPYYNDIGFWYFENGGYSSDAPYSLLGANDTPNGNWATFLPLYSYSSMSANASFVLYGYNAVRGVDGGASGSAVGAIGETIND